MTVALSPSHTGRSPSTHFVLDPALFRVLDHLFLYISSDQLRFLTKCSLCVLQEEATFTERKPRKSVAFSEGATVMDENGAITEAAHVEKNTAEKHSAGAS